MSPFGDRVPSSAEELDQQLRAALGSLDEEPGGAGAPGPVPEGGESGSALTATEACRLLDAQVTSRHCDLAARWMQAQGRGYYTIGSAGHEGNAAVAAALRPSDPALLHYRSGGFYIRRAWSGTGSDATAHPALEQPTGADPVRDVLRGVAASAHEPVAGGRHKVFGRHDLAVVPQTSTIASHLPRAVGVAFALDRARRLGVAAAWPPDGIVVASVGDASMNHSTALGALNAAGWAAYQRLGMPLLVVCEDNGLGISVPTPPGWVAASQQHRAGWEYAAADGCDAAATFATVRAAAARVREQRRPALVHLRTVRLLGHAGSDVESAYRTPAQIAADVAHDPVLATARTLHRTGVLTAAEIQRRYDAIRAHVYAVAAEVLEEPLLDSAAAVMAPIHGATPVRARGADHPSPPPAPVAAPVPGSGPPLTLAQSLNAALAELLEQVDEALVFGEDVARKGGVYGVTRGLQRRFGAARVFDTLLDEQTILGLALGAGLSGLLPVPEIQYLAYLHNAGDQLRGEAATLPFFSRGAYTNPMVVRIAGYAYQRGFGGHFHNDHSVAALRDIPGLVIASPARPDDAVLMLRSCVDLARREGRVCCVLEPIALYHTRDLLAHGDEGWLARFPAAGERAEPGRARTHGDGTDLTVVTWGNGLRLALEAVDELAREGVSARVVDLRWLAPLPVADLLAEARATGRVLVVDETRRTGGVSEAVLTALVDHGFTGPVRRVCAEDSFVPLGPAAAEVLVSRPDVLEAARALVTQSKTDTD